MLAPSQSHEEPSASTSKHGVAKRKLIEDRFESQDEKKAKIDKEERGVKRSIEEWDDFAKKMKMEAEQKAEANKNPGEGMDIDYLNVVREIMAASFGDSDVKYDETVHEFVDGDWNEQNEDQYYDAISGEPLVTELVEEARKLEMDTFRKHGV